MIAGICQCTAFGVVACDKHGGIHTTTGSSNDNANVVSDMACIACDASACCACGACGACGMISDVSDTTGGASHKRDGVYGVMATHIMRESVNAIRLSACDMTGGAYKWTVIHII